MKTIKDRNYSFNHFKKRLQKRFNLDINIKEYDLLCSFVENCTPITTEKQKRNTQMLYDIDWQDICIRVVWSEKRRCLTTVLPKRS